MNIISLLGTSWCKWNEWGHWTSRTEGEFNPLYLNTEQVHLPHSVTDGWLIAQFNILYRDCRGRQELLAFKGL